jgi:Flp pilus assembly protein TadG
MNIKNQNGGSLVEFVIIAPLLFVILFGIIEFGILIFDKAMITNASREGARAGIVFNKPLNDNEIRQLVRDYCEDHLISFGSGSEPEILINWGQRVYGEGESARIDQILTINVNYPFRFLAFSNVLALLGGDVADLVNLSAVTVMRLE